MPAPKKRHQELIADVMAMPDGPQVAAFFDFDGTLIYGYSAIPFIREQVRQGKLASREFMELAGAMTSFGLGNMGFSAMMVVTSQFMRGETEESYWDFGEALYKKHIARLVYPESRALVDAHLEKGHTVAIISSATPYQITAAARDLGISNVACTELEVKDGVLTGAVRRPTCFGYGKVRAAEQIAKASGADLDQSFFYSDSDDDLELLERVAYPRPLNPNRRLTAIAKQREWPIRRFKSRGRPGLGDWARSLAATGSLITSFAAGLPIWAITGSKRSAQNFSYSLFADTARALIGMDLKVRGEENLWSQRPAVFIFNHQSKADLVVAASLVRRDLAGVGKKEIKRMPVIGQVLEFGGMVAIDRENARSAIEAMAPLVDAIREDGRCVLLAPEGTRTVSPRLGPFKKGAFHLAMQAGVPIVPIVIHNALDVAPKGDFVFRPATVEVDVLPPVDTSGWTARTMNQHVKDVRDLYLQVLGQSEDESGSGSSRSDSAAPSSTPKAQSKRKPKTQPKAKPKPKPKTKIKPDAKTRTKPAARTKAKTAPVDQKRSRPARSASKTSAKRPVTGRKPASGERSKGKRKPAAVKTGTSERS
ncbi:MAG: HAD-IB family hydrolase [Pseudomonadota bacterium]